MTDTTPRLSLPMLQPGQSQKELFHNEALALIDVATPAVVEATGASTPPPAPAPGQAWAVGPSPVGDWTGRAGAIAGWTDGGWRFLPPIEGRAVWSRADTCGAQWLGGAWAIGDVHARRVLVDGTPVIGAAQPAIPAPAGGSVVDAEARATLARVLAALAAHGLIAASV